MEDSALKKKLELILRGFGEIFKTTHPDRGVWCKLCGKMTIKSEVPTSHAINCPVKPIVELLEKTGKQKEG